MNPAVFNEAFANEQRAWIVALSFAFIATVALALGAALARRRTRLLDRKTARDYASPHFRQQDPDTRRLSSETVRGYCDRLDAEARRSNNPRLRAQAARIRQRLT